MVDSDVKKEQQAEFHDEMRVKFYKDKPYLVVAGGKTKGYFSESCGNPLMLAEMAQVALVHTMKMLLEEWGYQEKCSDHAAAEQIEEEMLNLLQAIYETAREEMLELFSRRHAWGVFTSHKNQDGGF